MWPGLNSTHYRVAWQKTLCTLRAFCATPGCRSEPTACFWHSTQRTAGIGSRADLHAILAACFLSRGEHRTLFDQAFHIFWRDPDFLGRIMQMLMPQMKQRVSVPELPQNRRLAAALLGPSTAPLQLSENRIEIDAAFSWSDREQLRKVDFDTMTAKEWAAARRMLDRLPTLSALRETRRTAPAARGRRLDVRAMLRSAARQGGEMVMPTWRRRRMRPSRWLCWSISPAR